ncbi:serine protease grass-like [Drosophila nasuta]|uniref:serine protease grass-like n=1 Tax=Drosophila nasuta TaxID=42062 RepID=UPI00295F54B7|nr:serine protease grass-like [Drosophila nasuta]
MYRIRIRLLIFASCLASTLAVAVVEYTADDFCTRLDFKPGYCVPINNCTLVKNITARKSEATSELSADEELYIRNSECPVHKNGFVCCEDAEEVAKGVDDLNPDECGEFGTSKTIGGREIALMSRPWMTLLYIRDELDNEDFTCGGTLINKRYVLTAAHCFTRKTLLYVRLGEHKISQGRDCTRKRGLETCAPPVEDVEADRVYIHENYSSITGHNDIALIKLSRDVELKESIGPICLPVNETIRQSVSSMELFHVTGWGKTEVRFASDVPLETIVRAKDIDNCQKSYRRQIIPAQLCAGGLGRDACNGDSGGPLAYVKYLDGRQRFVQFGIVSFGSSNCGDGNPGVYTNVGSYIRWIAYKIATK